jgi:hypothetical protein
MSSTSVLYVGITFCSEILYVLENYFGTEILSNITMLHTMIFLGYLQQSIWTVTRIMTRANKKKGKRIMTDERLVMC